MILSCVFKINILFNLKNIPCVKNYLIYNNKLIIKLFLKNNVRIYKINEKHIKKIIDCNSGINNNTTKKSLLIDLQNPYANITFNKEKK